MAARILIHHHAIAFIEDDKIWIQSFIGIWVQELSKHFKEIGLLVQVSDSKKPEQDYPIVSKSVLVHKINPPNPCTRFQRNRWIKQVCKSVSVKYDLLLIRGITPRQMLIYENCSIVNKFYLLVGSLLDSKPSLRFSRISFVAWSLFWIRRLELKRISASAHMLANSPTITHEISIILGVSAKFIPTNTISRKDFAPLVAKDIGKPVKLLFCGRVVRDKGIEELIIALKLLKDANVQTTLDVLGSISEIYKSKLFRNIISLGLGAQVRFHGFVPFGEELLTFYRNSDIFVLPSWHEGFPHSIWEAAVSCSPVIVTPVGGIPGILTDNNVMFCEKRNSIALANAITECINDADATKARIVSLYELAMNYTVERCAEDVYAILTETAC
ncbi:MAG: glycosyltransferase family 4 protein [Bacteroidales bacterium]